MANCSPIGVFDSGLGGLTVVKELVKLLPNEDIVYFGDTDRVPYGTKSADAIRKFARQDEAFLLSKGVKLIVAACGTVSSVAADTADDLTVPFVGVVSNSSKAAVKATKNGRIGVIGTSATVSSGAHEREILKLLPDAKVFANSCTLFVPLVEIGWIDPSDVVVLETVKRYLAPIIENDIDTLILGCTHYPLLSEAIKKVVGDKVTLINMGEATALAVKEMLSFSGDLNDSSHKGSCSFYVSDLTPSFLNTASFLLGEEIDKNSVEKVEINEL